ncbi:hypothetical protein LCGC14_1387470 [marine sediment metagenome]|uniref:Phage morphogenesis protein n=1 Tax=marine sediment metagenome TaxID=412755 RepID=A0A0F9MGH5_9ZZZZ
MSVRIEHNFDIKSKQIQKYAKSLDREVLIAAMHKSLSEVATISTGDYMDLGSAEDAPVVSILSRRSGRLSFSIAGSEFKGKKESIRKVTATSGKIEGQIGSKVPYAQIQEKGGTTHPKVTAKSRGFFWHKFYETGDDKWKGMALTSKTQFDINIPARPYLRPAAKDAMPEIHRIFDEFIHESWNRTNI